MINAFYELIQKYRTASAKKYLQVNFILILQSWALISGGQYEWLENTNKRSHYKFVIVDN